MAPGPIEPLAVDKMETQIKQNGTAPSKPHEELQYLELVQEILETGEHRPDR